jgi:hypothetical protein
VLNDQEISISMYGLQGMSSEYEEVRTLLRVLTAKMNKVQGTLTAQGLSNILYGLHSMSSEHTEVLQFLEAFYSKLENSHHVFTSQNISNSLYGLQGMSSDHLAVRNILQLLIKKIIKSGDNFTGLGISTALYGLQSMSNNHVVVRELLSALCEKSLKSRDQLNGQHIGNSLYGLQLMKAEGEVEKLLNILYQKMLQSNEVMGCREVSNGLYGLIHLSSSGSEVAAKIIEIFVKCAAKDLIKYEAFESADLLRSMSLLWLQHEGNTTMSKIIMDEIRTILQFLNASVLDNRDNFSSQSLIENKVANIALQYLQERLPDASLTKNEMLAGFEADIIIRVPAQNGSPCRVVNIEVDGPSHQFPTSITFTGRRDNYLMKHFGYAVHRIDISKITGNINETVIYPMLDKILME